VGPPFVQNLYLGVHFQLLLPIFFSFLYPSSGFATLFFDLLHIFSPHYALFFFVGFLQVFLGYRFQCHPRLLTHVLFKSTFSLLYCSFCRMSSGCCLSSFSLCPLLPRTTMSPAPERSSQEGPANTQVFIPPFNVNALFPDDPFSDSFHPPF